MVSHSLFYFLGIWTILTILACIIASAFNFKNFFEDKKSVRLTKKEVKDILKI